MHYLYIILSFLAGVVLPIQVGLNATVAKSTSNPLFASILSFMVGTLGLLIYLMITRTSWPSATLLKAIPTYAWPAGLFGAFYVTVSILAAPKIGAATMIALVVAGQMACALVFDHYGWIGFPQVSINFWRILGGLLIVVGVVLIRKF